MALPRQPGARLDRARCNRPRQSGEGVLRDCLVHEKGGGMFLPNVYECAKMLDAQALRLAQIMPPDTAEERYMSIAALNVFRATVQIARWRLEAE